MEVKHNTRILYEKALFVIFIFLCGWWGYLQMMKFEDFSFQNQVFSSVYGILALFGAVFGFWSSAKWGGLKSVIGKAITYISFGLLCQFLGQLAYSFYLYYFKIEVPYPSIGDIPYFSTIVFYILGLISLGRASGMIFTLKRIRYKLLAVAIPSALLILSYFLFLKGYVFDWTNPIKVFLDFGYPLGDAIYVGIAILVFLSSKAILGGIMKASIWMLIFALFLQFIGDFSFLYLSYYSTVHPAGINDFIVMIAYFFMNLALIKVYKAHIEISNL
jgi:hypothetical protein